MFTDAVLTAPHISRIVSRIWLLMACVGLSLAPACKSTDGGSSGTGIGGSASAPAKPVKLAFVTNNASEFWKSAAAGLRKSEQEG